MCASVRAKEMKHSGTTQSTHSPREPPEVGGMRGKLCLRNEGQSSQRVCEHEVCVHTHRTQPRHLVDEACQEAPEMFLCL